MHLIKHSTVQKTSVQSKDPSVIVPGWVGSSPVVQQMLRQLAMFAPIHKAVLITGESGTGKESAARFIHHLSGLDPWVEACCTNMTPELIESQLSGHVRGAFTGAIHDHAGFFEQANGGTLFLDEIGDLPLDLQPHLLRLLQEGRVRRVGDTELRDVRVRVICATHRNLPEMVQHGTFRKDLYHRLACFQLKMPPLRERGHDILLLAHRYLEKEGLPRRLSRRAERALLTYHWPGNVRELQHVMLNAALNSSEIIELQTLTPFMEGLSAQQDDPHSAMRLSDTQRCILSEIQRGSGISVKKLSTFLRISQSTALRLLKSLVDQGLIIRQGQARATIYIIKKHTE